MLLKRILYLGFIFLLILIIFIVLSLPFRRLISARFVIRGDTYLAARAYDQALTEYQQSLRYNGKNELALKRIALTKDIIQDIRAGKSFFEEKNPDYLQKIDQADQNFGQAKIALESGLKYWQGQEKELALIPLLKSVELDPKYPEAWQGLRDLYQSLKENCPQNNWPECLEIFSEKAEQADEQLKILDPLR